MRRFVSGRFEERLGTILDLSAFPCLARLSGRSVTLNIEAVLFQRETKVPIIGDLCAKICNSAEISDTIVSHGDENPER